MDFALFTALAGQQGSPTRPGQPTSGGSEDTANGFATLIATLATGAEGQAVDSPGAPQRDAGRSILALVDPGTRAIRALVEDVAAALSEVLAEIEGALPPALAGDPRLTPEAVLEDPLAALAALADKAPELLGGQPELRAVAALVERNSAVASSAPIGSASPQETPAPRAQATTAALPANTTAALDGTPLPSPVSSAANLTAQTPTTEWERTGSVVAERTPPATTASTQPPAPDRSGVLQGSAAQAVPPATPAVPERAVLRADKALPAAKPSDDAVSNRSAATQPGPSEVAVQQTSANRAASEINAHITKVQPAQTAPKTPAGPQPAPDGEIIRVRRLVVQEARTASPSDEAPTRPTQTPTGAPNAATPQTEPGVGTNGQALPPRPTTTGSTVSEALPTTADQGRQRTASTQITEETAVPPSPAADPVSRTTPQDPAPLTTRDTSLQPTPEARTERGAPQTVLLDGAETAPSTQPSHRSPAATAALLPPAATAESARAIAPQIASAITAQQAPGRIELQLDPPELGRIEIALEIADQGLRATLSAERATTGDLVRRHGELLMQQLQNAGFADVDLRFADGQTRHGSHHPAGNTGAEGTDAPPDEPTRHIARGGSEGLDLRL